MACFQIVLVPIESNSFVKEMYYVAAASFCTSSLPAKPSFEWPTNFANCKSKEVFIDNSIWVIMCGWDVIRNINLLLLDWILNGAELLDP